jgi:hypothetical protein
MISAAKPSSNRQVQGCPARSRLPPDSTVGLAVVQANPQLRLGNSDRHQQSAGSLPGGSVWGSPSARRRPAATDSGRLAQERAAGSGCAKRVMPPGPAIRILPLRRNRATGVPAACRHPGEVAARRRFWMVRHSPPDTAQMMDAAPSRAAHPHPPAGGRGDGPRAAGAGTGQRHRGAGIEADIAAHGRGARGICGSTWRLHPRQQPQEWTALPRAQHRSLAGPRSPEPLPSGSLHRRVSAGTASWHFG